MSTEDISQLLRERRRELNLTQSEVASQLGLSQPGYSNIERGKVALGEHHFDGVQRVLKIRVEELMDRLLDLATPTERAIAVDPLLNRTHKRVALMLYGEATGRNSIGLAALQGLDEIV